MLDIKVIKENPEAVKAALKAKEVDCDATVDLILELDGRTAYDFGYLTFLVLLAIVLGTIIVGLMILRQYRHKRESKNRKYLGKEVLLIGSLTGFISQGIIGLFLFNRTVNGMALLTFMFLGSLVLAHTVTIRRDSNDAVSR